MKKLYIFDFDGTLVNTFFDSVLAYNKALEQHGLPLYEYTTLNEIDYNDFTSSMIDDMDVLKTYSELYEKSNKENTLAYPGIKKVLQQLINEEKEVAICSNRIQNQLEEYVEKIFPEIKFKYIIGYERNGPYKPNPEVMNKILDQESITKEEIIYVGDKKEDIITAKNVDVDVVIVKWGQGDYETYADEYPLKIIDKASELLNL